MPLKKKKQTSDKTSGINIAILKFFLAKGIDLNSIDSPFTLSMVNLLNPNHIPPDSTIFSTTILEQAVSNNFSLNLSKSTTGVIELLTVDTEDTVFVLTTLLCHNEVEIFLQLNDCERVASLNNDDTVITWLIECCETIHELLRFMNENSLLQKHSTCREQFFNKLTSLIKPIHLFIKCLNPKLYDQFIRTDENLGETFFQFLPTIGAERIVCPQVLNGVGYYLDQDGDFKKYFNCSLEEHAEDFWKSMNVSSKNRQLCEFALSAIAIPSCTRYLDLLDFRRRLNKYPEQTQHGFQALLYSIWAVDKK